MLCPFCMAEETRVVDSRVVGESSQQIRRRRECLGCQARFTTYETIELSLPRVIKSNGSYVEFDLQKLRSGMLKALEKRPVSSCQLEVSVNAILHKLRVSGEKDVSTKVVGEWVMAELLKLDEIAYIRFASVYNRFDSIDAFLEEIALLRKSKQTN